MGQQIYKLIILDFLVPFVLTFIVEYPRRFVIYINIYIYILLFFFFLTLSTRKKCLPRLGKLHSFIFDFHNILQGGFSFQCIYCVIIRLVYQRFHERYKVVNMMGQQEFDLPKAVLDLVYTQTLCW